MKEWLALDPKTRLGIFEQISNLNGMPVTAIEKDWWVVKTLELIFRTEIGPHTVFKGGTSLSKAWGLIEPFSEDIDLALDRGFLGFEGELSGKKLSKLREASFKYLSGTYKDLLKKEFLILGLDVSISILDANSNDPINIEIQYQTIAPSLKYLRPRILVEIGSRSLMEPHTDKFFSSLVGEYFAGQPFADTAILIPCVNPERTFLEKIFLLHEEFQKSSDKCKTRSN